MPQCCIAYCVGVSVKQGFCAQHNIPWYIDFVSALHFIHLIRESFGIEGYTTGLQNHHALFISGVNDEPLYFCQDLS